MDLYAFFILIGIFFCGATLGGTVVYQIMAIRSDRQEKFNNLMAGWAEYNHIKAKRNLPSDKPTNFATDGRDIWR